MIPVASFTTEPAKSASGKAYALPAVKGAARRTIWLPVSHSKFEGGILYVADWLMGVGKDLPILLGAGFSIVGATPVAAVTVTEVVPMAMRSPERLAEAVIQKGFFTVEGEGARHLTFRIKTHAQTRKTVIGLLQGRNNMSDYAWFAYVDGASLRYFRNPQLNGSPAELRVSREVIETAWQVIKGDPTVAGRRFARESKQCMRCGKELTTPESLNIGLGPVCDGRDRPFN